MTDEPTCHCLGLGCAFCNDAARIEALRAERAALHDQCKLQQNAGEFTHSDEEGRKFRLTTEQAQKELELFCRLWLLTRDEELPLQEKREPIKERMARLDAAVQSFLASPRVIHDEAARMVNSAFADALREFSGIRATQQAITQAARRAGVKSHSSHAVRFLLGIKLA